jgi:hypothetical protein
MSGRHASPEVVSAWPQKAAMGIETFRATQAPPVQPNPILAEGSLKQELDTIPGEGSTLALRSQ